MVIESARMDSTEVSKLFEICEYRSNAIAAKPGRLLLIEVSRFLEIVCRIGENDDIFQ
jgi:hypothetical protein